MMLRHPSPRRREQLALTLILMVLVATRLGRVFPDADWDVKQAPTDWRRLVGDAYTYDIPASNLVNGLGYSHALEPPYTPGLLRTPAYPLLLAAIYTLAGRREGAVQLVDALLDVAAALLLLSVARRYVGDGWALALLAVAALLAPWSTFLGRGVSEPLTTFLLCLSLRLCTDIKESPLRWLALGLSLGALVLCRPVFALLPLLVIAWAIAPWRRLSTPRAFIATWLVVGVAAVWAPWVLRNALATGRFVPLSCGGSGLSLWLTTWSDQQETWSIDPQPDGTVVRRLPARAFENDAQRLEMTAAFDRYIEAFFRYGDLRLCDVDKTFAAAAVQRIKAAPFHWLGGQVVRLLRLLRQPLFFESWWQSETLSLLIAAVFGLGVVAGVALALRAHDLQPAAIFFLYTWGIHLPTHAEPRYLSPAYGAGLLLGFVALARLVPELRRRLAAEGAPD